MSNLPNSQIDNDINDTDVADNAPPVKPGGVFSNTPTPLGSPEGSFVPEAPKPIETQQSPELTPIPVPTPPQPDAFKERVTLSNPTEGSEPTPNVVDQTDQITTLHEIKETKDKLTKEADEEEEHFIEEVEKHHGDL